MHRLLWLLLVALPSVALYESDAEKVDWHKELIGIPRVENVAIAPRFERTPGRVQHSFIVTVSKSNVLAAVDTAEGSVAWRHVLEPLDVVKVFRSNPGFIITLSGPRGANLRSYEASTGHLIFEKQLLGTEVRRLSEPPGVGEDVVFSVDKTSDIFTLTNASILRRIDGMSGEFKWEWRSEDQSSSLLFYKVVSTEKTTFIIGLRKLSRSYGLIVVSLEPSTGASLSSAEIPSSINDPSDVVVLTSSRSPQPTLVWLGDNGYIQTVSLSPDLKVSSRVLREDIYEEVKDVGIADAGIFVALKRDDTSHVIRMDSETQSVRKIWEFSNSASSSDHSESVYSGGVDATGQPYVARAYRSHTMHAFSFHLFAPNGGDGRGVMSGFTFDFDSISNGAIQHFAFEVANPQPYVYVARIMYTTSSGALQLWQQDNIQWTREESLTEINAVDFVDLPEKTGEAGTFDGPNFFARVVRQIGEVRNLPSYATGFGRRFLVGSSAPRSVPETEDGAPLWRDDFGFRKLLITATSSGKIFGIDTARGKILWSRLLVEGSYGGSVQPFKMFSTATVSDGKRPEISLVAHRQSPSNERNTVVYHFEALTGLDIGHGNKRREVLQGMSLFRGSAIEAYLVRGEKKIVVIIGEDLKVHLYPNDDTSHALLAKMAPSLHFTLEDTSSNYHRLIGHQIQVVIEEGTFQAFASWNTFIDPVERIQTVVRRPHEPVASIGKVLGDRNTLFKYLNPHLVAVLTTSQRGPPRCSIYLVDAVKGTVVYHAVVPPTGGVCATKAALTENWLIYHYYDEGLQAFNGSKGYRMVSVELYEGSGTNDKTRSSDLTSYSYDNSLLTVFQQAFVFPHEISAMATTSTKFGISAKSLIVANAKQQIQHFPRRLFDPRRPKQKPTSEEQEEWLVQYDPLIPDDPRWVVSHNYKVAGTENIVTSPALLESTSIVLAYGLDLFLTRVAPSNTFDILSESFNKAQLVLTVAALTLGVAVARPMALRKQVKHRWYYS